MAEATKLSVVAEDGKTYEFGERTKVQKESYIAEDGTVVVKFVFRNGAVRTHEIAPADPLRAHLAMHGANQKFGDDFAGLDDVEDCIESFNATSARLADGVWTEKRTSDGMAGSSLLIRALVEVGGKPADHFREILKRLRDEPNGAETIKALRLQPKVAQVIARLKEERDAKKAKPDQAAADAALAAVLGN